MVDILFVQPSFDDPTSIQARFFLKILDWAKKVAKDRGYRYIVLFGDKANEYEFKKAILLHDPKFIYFGGHGKETKLMGQFLDTLVLMGYNEWLLEGRMIYAFTCDTAKVIGRMSGAKAYLGYEEEFILPPEEKYFPMFMKIGFYPLRLLLHGETFGNSYKKTKRYYVTLMKKARNLYKDILLYKILKHDYKSLKLYGDPDARLR